MMRLAGLIWIAGGMYQLFYGSKDWSLQMFLIAIVCMACGYLIDIHDALKGEDDVTALTKKINDIVERYSDAKPD